MRPAPTTDDIGSVCRVTTRYTREPLGRLTQIANLSPKRSGPHRKPMPYATLTDAAGCPETLSVYELFSCPDITTKGVTYGRNSALGFPPPFKRSGLQPGFFANLHELKFKLARVRAALWRPRRLRTSWMSWASLAAGDNLSLRRVVRRRGGALGGGSALGSASGAD